MTATQPGLAVSDPQAYRDRLFKLVGDRDPLDVMAQTPSALTYIAHQHSPATLRSRPFAGKWTPNEIIGHLGDGEWVYGYRLRLILCEDNPAMCGTNQDAWVSRQRHNDREPADLLEIFRTTRQLNLALWNSISRVDLQRTGHHNERGPESLAVMLRLTAGHDLAHLDQITRYLQAILQTK
jgi:hypothetical protein